MKRSRSRGRFVKPKAKFNYNQSMVGYALNKASFGGEYANARKEGRVLVVEKDYNRSGGRYAYVKVGKDGKPRGARYNRWKGRWEFKDDEPAKEDIKWTNEHFYD